MHPYLAPLRGLASSSSSRHPSTAPPPPPPRVPLAAAEAAYAVPSRFARYAPRLHAAATRTGVPLPTLALSFVLLHELTALVPLVGAFYAFHAAGAGGRAVGWIRREAGLGDAGGEGAGAGEGAGVRAWLKGWYDEGERRVEKVGRRYGILGYEKGSAMAAEGGAAGAAGAVADAVAAYVVVKALLPARIGVSVAAAPAFARWTLLPLQRLIRRGR